MENNFSSLINQANSVLILLAKNPYLDQVAAGLSLYLALKNSKNVQIASSSSMMVEHNRLVGVDKVTMDPGNKNLVIKFSNYVADNIERVSYDVEGQEFKLSVIPKPQFDAPTREQVELSYSGVAADLIVLVGGMNESHFPLLTSNQLVDSKLVHIGVQTLVMESKREVISFAEGTASTSEVTYKLLKQLNLDLNQDIASNLLMGMQEGTKNFTHGRVTAETFEMAADLMKKGASMDPRQAEEQKQYPVGAIPGQSPLQPTPSQNPASQRFDASGIQNEKPQSEVESEPHPTWLQPKIYKGSSKS